MSEKFELGQRVTVKAEVLASKLYKVNPYLKNNTHGRRDYIREWSRHELKKPVNGIIAGMRTVKEGYSDYIGPEEGFAFIPMRHINVYLVATSIRTFIRVLPEDIEVTA